MMIGAVYYCRTIDFFPITNVQLFVDQPYMDTIRLKQLVSSELRGNFFTLSLTPIVQKLLTNDQIKTVSVKRVWPNALSIYIDGYEPLAFFNQDSVITTDGYVFKTPKNLKMPLEVYLQGPTDRAQDMVQYLKLFNKILTPLKVTIKDFKLDDSALATLTLSNNIKLVLGDHDFGQRLNQFVKLYSKIIGKCLASVESVDLRYSNGLAVKWNDEEKCIRR